MKQNLRVSLGAVVLALATLAAVIFALLNFDQRNRYDLPYDGVTWIDTDHGVEARHVVPNSPASHTAIHEGDVLLSFDGAAISRATEVARLLDRAGLWTQVRYKLSRKGQEFETPLVTATAEKPLAAENYLRAVGLLYLFIGLFIFIRRWNAPRAVHFYIFCLASFIVWSFHFSGKLDIFDWEIYWSEIAARLLVPALLLHFALVFPGRTESKLRANAKLMAVYLLPLALLLVHVSTAVNALGFVPWLGSYFQLNRLEFGYLAVSFVLAGLVFYRKYREAASGVLRQQLKWLTAGTFLGSLPASLLYLLPVVILDTPAKSWMLVSTLSLLLIPLCFAYAIIRYRLMDVDIIFKRGLAYTAATAAVATVYFSLVALSTYLFHAPATGPVGGMIAIVIAAFLFQPFRQWIQARLDRFFYRDRLDYRRTLIEFGRTLTNEVRLDPMLGSVMDRISQTLLVDRLAVFVDDPEQPAQMRLARSMGVRLSESMDLSFLDPVRPEFARGALFFESPRAAKEVSDSVRRTLEQLDLNYFIPCRIREHTVAVLGLGKTVDGDFLSSDDVELVETIAGYVAVALDNAQLYSSLEQKALEIARLKDFSENIVESLNVGVLAVDLEGIVESWNTRMEQLFGVLRRDAVGRRLNSLLPEELTEQIAARQDQEHISGIYKQRFEHQGKHLTLNISITPLVSKSNECIGRLLLFDDVTQRERLE
ncbi:MAG TPA: PAS domain-containing protein, partial [Candidatus Acidoferrum sp.]